MPYGLVLVSLVLVSLVLKSLLPLGLVLVNLVLVNLVLIALVLVGPTMWESNLVTRNCFPEDQREIDYCRRKSFSMYFS